MKKCIWCLKGENETKFYKKAHIIPKSLGGNCLVKNVCDGCNEFFGFKKKGGLSIEVIGKEILNVARFVMEKPKQRFKSQYFNLNLKTNKFRAKPEYWKLNDQILLRCFKKFIYKLYLEFRENKYNDSVNSIFSFIRNFCINDKFDYPIYYSFSKMAFNKSDKIFKCKINKNIYKNCGFIEYSYYCHHFHFPIITGYNLTDYIYLKKQENKRLNCFTKLKELKSINDIDISLKQWK